MTLASAFFIASAAVAGLLGGLHMLYTFCSNKFAPRDPALHAAMMTVAPVISRETTMWRAGQGFHASHSVGVICYALIYADLAWYHMDVLMRWTFILVLGAAWLLAYLVFAWRYWFRVPLRGIALACVLYFCGVAAIVTST